ncbi:hypothetical protein SAY87_027556 [Trapa incisa]|uniref:Uncharacterized protein n=1 Tax=Trapa incisa TaxID=236973 RepID=A0AAN7PI66_9MYRT|nr:hypothetical protein SAY87_027556 [Trapa incisa]
MSLSFRSQQTELTVKHITLFLSPFKGRFEDCEYRREQQLVTFLDKFEENELKGGFLFTLQIYLCKSLTGQQGEGGGRRRKQQKDCQSEAAVAQGAHSGARGRGGYCCAAVQRCNN